MAIKPDRRIMGNALPGERSRGGSQRVSRSSRADDSYLYIVAFIGVATGFTLAFAVWLVNSVMAKDAVSSITPESTVVINAREIRETNNDIRHLHARVDSLTKSIASLEAMLRRITLLTDIATYHEKNNRAPARPDNLHSDSAKPAYNRDKPDASAKIGTNPETQQNFVPTHTVNDWLNLRPSSSLNSEPIAVLKLGSEVEYISEKDDWYYVNTPTHGKGWCYSAYLSPLSPTQENTSGVTPNLQSKLP